MQNIEVGSSVVGFKIVDLFGSLTHIVELKSGGVTFIHGPNGSGKTTALLLLEYVLTLRLEKMKQVIFSSMEVNFSDGITIAVERSPVTAKGKLEQTYLFEDSESLNGEIFDIKVGLKRGKSTIERSVTIGDSLKIEEIRQQVMQRPSTIERLAPGLLERVGTRMWKIIKTGEFIGNSEVSTFIVESTIRASLPSWLIERTRHTKLDVIRAQRLYEFNDSRESAERAPEVKQIVSVFSEDVKNKINQKIAESALQFQKKEKTFPHRILSGGVKGESEAILRLNYIKLQERVSTLESVGLQESSDSLVLPQIKLNPTHKRVLTLYLSDINEKLDVFNDIFEQISLMSELLSNKLRRKKFTINRTDGFKLESIGGAKISLKPTDLSSGEQHQLVMLYKLIFSDIPNQLYLIDEPEISLHVEWQRQFSDDLRRIAEARGHRFVIATHSPQIINGRLDLAIPLDGGIHDE